MIKFDLAVEIYRPLHEVFAFVATPENDFHWQYGTLTSAQISNGELGIGTLFRSVGHFMGRRMESIYAVTEFEADQRYAFRSQSGSGDLYILYTFELVKGSTKMSIFAQLDQGETLMARETATQKSMKKQYRENLALLKDILETSAIDEKPSDSMWLVSGRRK